MREGILFRRPSWPECYKGVTALVRCHFTELFVIFINDDGTDMEYPYSPRSRADLLASDWERVLDAA